MALRFTPTSQQITSWREFVATRPQVVRAAIGALEPWRLYRMKSTGQRVFLYSASEGGTLTVVLSGEYNLVAMEHRIFGIAPDDLEECDLPAAGEPLGVYLTRAEQRHMVDRRRAENGVGPISDEEWDA